MKIYVCFVFFWVNDNILNFKHIFGTNVRYNEALAVQEMPERLDAYEIGLKFLKII